MLPFYGRRLSRKTKRFNSFDLESYEFFFNEMNFSDAKKKLVNGFKNINRKEYTGINLDTLQVLADNGKIDSIVNLDVLVANRLARKNDLVKILGRGELKAKLNITVHKFTATAKAAIEAAGGEAITL